MAQLATPLVGHAAAIVVVILSLFYLTTERQRDYACTKKVYTARIPYGSKTRGTSRVQRQRVSY